MAEILRLTASEISEFLGVSREGDVTYFENATSTMLFRQYILAVELEGSILKLDVRYRNIVNATDLTNLAYAFR